MFFLRKRKGLFACFLLGWVGALVAGTASSSPLVGSFYMSEEGLKVLAHPDVTRNPYQTGRANILDKMVERSSILSIDELSNRNRTQVDHGVPWEVFVDQCTGVGGECSYLEIRDLIINGNSAYVGAQCDSPSLTSAQGWLCVIDRTKESMRAIPDISTKYVVIHDELGDEVGTRAASAKLVDPVGGAVDINYTAWLPNDISSSVVTEGGTSNPYSSLFDGPVGTEIVPVVDSFGNPVSPAQSRTVSDVFGAGGYRSAKVRGAVSRYAAFLMEHYQSDEQGKEFHVDLYIPYREHDALLLSFFNMNNPASDPYKQVDGLLSIYADIIGRVKQKSPATIVAPSWQAQILAAQVDAKDSPCDKDYDPLISGSNPISCYNALRKEIKKYYLVNKKAGINSVLAWSFYLSAWVPGNNSSKTFKEFASAPSSLSDFADDSNNYFVGVLNDLSTGEAITTCIPKYFVESCMGGSAPQTTIQSVAIPHESYLDETGAEVSAVPIFFSETSWPVWIDSSYDFISLDVDQNGTPLIDSTEEVQLAYYHYLLNILPTQIDYELLGVTNVWEMSLSAGANSIFGSATQYQANGLFRPAFLSERPTDAALYFYSNNNTADFDGDGINDITVSHSGPSVTDIVVSRDNCPFVSNPSQDDSDGDGVGDACDSYPYIANSLQHDLNLNGKVDTPLILKFILLNAL